MVGGSANVLTSPKNRIRILIQMKTRRSASPAPRRQPGTGGVRTLREPVQARSRETLDRFLLAAEDLLGEKRFEEITVAEIVGRAGASVGAFYARFQDKDALLDVFDDAFFETSRALWDELLEPARWEGRGAAEIAAALVEALVAKSRARPRLLRALSLHARSHPGSPVAARGVRLNAHVAEGVERLLLTRRKEIAHPEPARAISLGFLMVASAVREAIVFEDAGLGARANDRDLARSRLFRLR